MVGLLWLVALLNYLDHLMITTMRDPIKSSIAMTDAQFGLLTSVFLWVYGALSPFGAFSPIDLVAAAKNPPWKERAFV